MLLCFSFQHGRHPRTVSFSLSGCMMKQESAVVRGPIKSRFHSHIWWHNTKNGFFFLFFFTDCPQIPVWPPWWIFIGYWSAEDAKIPTRCEGHDLQIIGLKRGWGGGFLPWTVCFSVERHNVVGCPAAWKEKRKRRKPIIFINHNCFFVGILRSRTCSFNEIKPLHL